MKTKRTFTKQNASAISLPWIHILLTLADAPRHGYAIMREVETRTGGHVVLWPATLYGAIRRMEEEGLVREVDAPRDADDPRRKYYALTGLGKRVLSEEVARLADLISVAKQRNVLGTQ